VEELVRKLDSLAQHVDSVNHDPFASTNKKS
jgi:hypothetical protein